MNHTFFFDKLQFKFDHKKNNLLTFIKSTNSSIMHNREEKLSLLSEMIAFAKKDDNIKSIEYNFLLDVAKQLNIPKIDFDYLIDAPDTYIHLKSHSERIVQFYRLVLLMSMDQEITSIEIVKLHNIGLRMGLSHESINRMFELMNSLPNKIVPPDFLIDIFKVQYN